MVNNAHADNIVTYLRDEIDRGIQICDDLRREKVEKQVAIRTFKKRVASKHRG